MQAHRSNDVIDFLGSKGDKSKKVTSKLSEIAAINLKFSELTKKSKNMIINKA